MKKALKLSANPEWSAAMQLLRRSNATVPVPSKKRYRRRSRSARREG